MRESCAFVVLCGGKASRMGGRNKALVTVDGESFLEKLSRAGEAFQERLLSTNDPGLAQGTGFLPVKDRYEDAGPMSGIYSALLAAKSGAILTVPCDLPEFSAELAEFMLKQMPPDGDALICVDSAGKKHPLCGIFKKSCLPVLKAHLDTSRLKIMGMLETLNTVYLDVSEHFDDRVFWNINTPRELTDYEEAKKNARQGEAEDPRQGGTAWPR